MEKWSAITLAATGITSAAYLAITSSHSATVAAQARRPMPEFLRPRMMGQYTVVIPTLNEAGNIREALDSLFNQSVQPLEIVVVDSDSNDGTRQIASSYPRTRVIRIHEVGNVGLARDTGVAAARTDVVMAMDADTIWGWNVAEESLADLASGEWDIVHAPGMTKNLAANTLYYAIYARSKPAWRIDGRHIATTKAVLKQLGGFHGLTCETYALGLQALKMGMRVKARSDLPVIFTLNMNRQRRAPSCPYHPLAKNLSA